jgi:hypothetical protein
VAGETTDDGRRTMDEGADLSQRPSPTGDDAGGCALDAGDALPVAGAFRRNHVGSHGTSVLVIGPLLCRFPIMTDRLTADN